MLYENKVNRIAEKVNNGEFLTVDDIIEIVGIINTLSYKSLLEKILVCLRKDLNTRKERFQEDPIKKLQRYSPNVRRREVKNSEKALMYMMIRAVLMSEFERYEDLIGNEWMKGKITEKEYLQKLRDHYRRICNVWPV